MLKLLRVFTVIAAIVVAAAVAWRNWGTGKANALVDEGNTAAQTGNSLSGQAGAKYAELFAEANLQGFPGNRAKLEPAAKELTDLLTQAAEQYRLAAARFEEAAQQPADSKVVDYWKLEAQMCRKFADSKEAFGRVPAMISDPGVQNLEQLLDKIGGLTEAAGKLDKESKEIAAAANKHKEAHKDKFKK